MIRFRLDSSIIFVKSCAKLTVTIQYKSRGLHLQMYVVFTVYNIDVVSVEKNQSKVRQLTSLVRDLRWSNSEQSTSKF